MRLIWSTKEFVLGGRPYPAFPILLWDSLESCVEANEFLRYYLLIRGRIGSENSWASTGRALYDYFSFLQAHGLHWKDTPDEEKKSLLSGYRDYSFDVSTLARNTIRQRLTYIAEFYRYAHTQGWVQILPYDFEDRAVPGAARRFAHVDSGCNRRQVRDVMPKKHKALPKFLSKNQVVSLLQRTDNTHHKMILRMGLQLGLRREEIATFPLAYVFDPIRAGRNERNIRLRLDPYDGHGLKTKGMKARDVYVSRRFLSDLHHYVVHHRGERASLSKVKREELFLNQAGEPFAGGGITISELIRKAGARAGITLHTHMLRHTYATHTLVTLQRNRSKNAIEPLVFVQRQLGHESIKTTMVYLHLINELADDAVLAYDDELNDWVEAN